MFNLWALLFERGMITSEVNNSQIGVRNPSPIVALSWQKCAPDSRTLNEYRVSRGRLPSALAMLSDIGAASRAAHAGRQGTFSRLLAEIRIHSSISFMER